MLSTRTKTGALPFSRSCERAGLLADIAAADHRIHAKLLTTTRCPARFPVWNRIAGGPLKPGFGLSGAVHRKKLPLGEAASYAERS
jgi:hypothetical protein